MSSAADLFRGLSKGSPNKRAVDYSSSPSSKSKKSADAVPAFYTKVVRIRHGEQVTRQNSTCIIPLRTENGAAKALCNTFYGRNFYWNPLEGALVGPTETTEMSQKLWAEFQQDCPNSATLIGPDFSGFAPDKNPVPCVLTLIILSGAGSQPDVPFGHPILVLIGSITYPLKNWIKRREAHGLDLDFEYAEIWTSSENMRRAWSVINALADSQADNVKNYFEREWGLTVNVDNLSADELN